MVSAPLCGECLDGWRVDPDTLLPVDRCPCRHRNATPAQARDAGMGATVEANPAAMKAALRIVRDAALARPELSSNDTRTEMRLAQVPGPVVGAAFRQAVKDRVLIPVGYVTSTDVGTHSHPVRSYESRIYRLGRTAS
jgi:hypothetical protein